MRSRLSIVVPVTAAVMLAGATARAGQEYQATDFALNGWWMFFSELASSIDALEFAFLILLLVLLGMCLDLVNHLRINKLIPDALLGEVQEEMANGEYEKALEVCEKADCLIGQIFAAALSKTDHTFERMEDAMRGEAKIQGLFWRQWVGQLRSAAYAGVLLGLMGACINVMRFVADLTGRPNLGLALASSFEMRALAYNVFTALFLGCLMSFIALVAHSFCSSKLEKILLEAERLGEELLDPFRPLPLPQEE